MAIPTPGVISMTAAPARSVSVMSYSRCSFDRRSSRPSAGRAMRAPGPAPSYSFAQRHQRLVGEAQRREDGAVELRVDAELRLQQAGAGPRQRRQLRAQRREQRLALAADAAADHD